MCSSRRPPVTNRRSDRIHRSSPNEPVTVRRTGIGVSAVPVMNVLEARSRWNSMPTGRVGPERPREASLVPTDLTGHEQRDGAGRSVFRTARHVREVIVIIDDAFARARDSSEAVALRVLGTSPPDPAPSGTAGIG